LNSSSRTNHISSFHLQLSILKILQNLLTRCKLLLNYLL
jgi:hypothetical protein